MAKLSASALRTAAANAREKSAENAVVTPTLHEVVGSTQEKEETAPAVSTHEAKEEPVIEPEARVSSQEAPAKEPESTVKSNVKNVLRSYESERKTEHVNLLITPSLSRKIETIQKQGEFRSKNAAVIAVLEAFCDANDIE